MATKTKKPTLIVYSSDHELIIGLVSNKKKIEKLYFGPESGRDLENEYDVTLTSDDAVAICSCIHF